MYPNRHRFPFPVLSIVLATALAAGCLGNDFRDATLSINEFDHGWLVAIEPEEQFDVGLTGNAVYPDAPWRIVEYDPAVIALDGEDHMTPRPPSGDPEGSEAEDYDPGSLVSSSFFGFTGLSLGETLLRFEIVVDGEAIDVAEYRVSVVEDACDAGTPAVANRCGGDGFAYHSQVEFELAHGQELAVEPGTDTHLRLTANALHPDSPWQLVDSDPDVVAVEVKPLGAARTRGDFSEVEAETPHSFLPAWDITIRGVALGEAPLVLEITVDGKPVDRYERTVLVVEDAAALDEE